MLRFFEVQGEVISAHSELKPVQKAREDYEAGIEAGHLSTMAQVYGDGVVNLNIGNIRSGEIVIVHIEVLAGVESRDDGFRFRFPSTLAPANHGQAQAVVNEWVCWIKNSPAAAQCLKEALLKCVADNAADEVFDQALSQQLPVDDIQKKQP